MDSEMESFLLHATVSTENKIPVTETLLMMCDEQTTHS